MSLKTWSLNINEEYYKEAEHSPVIISLYKPLRVTAALFTSSWEIKAEVVYPKEIFSSPASFILWDTERQALFSDIEGDRGERTYSSSPNKKNRGIK